MEHVKRHLWFIFLILGIVGFCITWLCLPHQGNIRSAWEPIFKLAIYCFIIGSIAFFPNRTKYGHLLASLPFLVFLGYIMPRISYFGFTGAAVADGKKLSGEFYTILYLLLFPMINFTTAFAYRMGGGTPGNTVKLSLTGVVLIFSGFLDILWYLVNPVSIPPTLANAHHITIFFGRPATYAEGVVFALLHLPLLVGLFLLPFDKWFASLLPQDQRIEKPVFAIRGSEQIEGEPPYVAES